MRITESFSREKYRADKKILIYGAGNYGAIAKAALEKMDIPVYAFVDRAQAGKQYFGIKCLHPDELGSYTNDIVIIASLNYFYDMLAYCKSIGAKYIYDMENLMQVKVDEEQLSEYVIDELHNPEKYRNVVSYSTQEMFVVNHVEMVITECCTLKCRDCANLMQYYNRPENMDIKALIEQFDRFISCIDILLDLRILGGEPFIVRNIDEVIRHYADNEKIKKITIYTNSTLVPGESILNSLRHPKVSVHMSNYSGISRKVNELDEALNKYGVTHYIHLYEKWNDLGNCERRNTSIDAAKSIFSECVMARCLTFYRGKLYLCPRSAHGEKLGFFRNKREDLVDFTDDSYSREDKKEETARLINTRNYTTACFYCNGSNIRSKEVDAAVQAVR